MTPAAQNHLIVAIVARDPQAMLFRKLFDCHIRS
jgi:hypothetical protein